jgi:nitronate monooxygenase
MKWPKLRIGDLEAKIPIIQGGMGVGISLSGLAAAVANQGGIGVIATAALAALQELVKELGLGLEGISFEEACKAILQSEIRKAKAATKGIIGVNIMVALTNFADLVEASIKEGIDVILAGAGVSKDLPKYLEGAKTKLIPIISSAKAARIICKLWWSRYSCLPDAFVVEGPMAGGHLGFIPEQIDDPNYALEKIIPEVIEVVNAFEKERGVKIPVIAAGGIYTGEDIYKFIGPGGLGASGVQMGTRFVATHECDADEKFKQAYVDAKKEDLIIIESPVHLPGRAIRNEFLSRVAAGERSPVSCPYHCITSCNCKDSPYCIALALANAQKGKLKGGFAFAGQNAWRINEIISVEKLIETLKAEYSVAAESAAKTT